MMSSSVWRDHSKADLSSRFVVCRLDDLGAWLGQPPTPPSSLATTAQSRFQVSDAPSGLYES